MRGELLLLAASDATKAEACYQSAIKVARAQRAKMLELRAATSLARLWRNQGKYTEAYELLAAVYDWFGGGSDLKEARLLLETVVGENPSA
jgi:predicted ATPase